MEDHNANVGRAHDVVLQLYKIITVPGGFDVGYT